VKRRVSEPGLGRRSGQFLEQVLGGGGGTCGFPRGVELDDAGCLGGLGAWLARLGDEAAADGAGKQRRGPAEKVDIEALPESLEPSKPIAVVCGSGERGAVGASLIQKHGAQDVIHVIEGGVPKWQ
jgi:hypothetical protein